MKKIIALILFTLSVNNLFAQTTFNKSFGGTGTGACLGAIQTTDGGYALGGYIYSNGITSIDLSLVKMNADGSISWNKTYGGLDADYTSGGFEQTTDGGYILLGYSSENTPTSYSFNNKIVKTNANGDTLWTKLYTINNNYSYYNNILQITNVRQTKDGGYVLLGTYSESDTTEAYYAALIKTDQNGNIQWSKLYSDESTFSSGPGTSSGLDVAQTQDQGFIITALGDSYIYSGSGSGYDIHLIKTDGNGNEMWGKEINLDASGGSSSIRQTSDGGYALTDYAYNYGFDSTYFVKTDNSGNIQWAKNYYTALGGINDAHFIETSDGGYVLSGSLTNFYETGSYGHLIKINNTGDTLWTQSFGPLFQNTLFSAVLQGSDKGYFAAGVTGPNTQGSVTDMFFVKTDVGGNTNCNSSYNSIEVAPLSPIEQSFDIYSASLAVSFSSWPLRVGHIGTDNQLCNGSGISVVGNNIKVSVYPNPTEQIINVSVPSSAIISSVQVFDVTGRNIISQSFEGNLSMPYSIDMSGQAKGYYIIRVNSSEGVINRSFVLQ